eukprot:m.60023 g.60023  ORF g.60023 m.60023 type:complete len:120 (-) comp13046_c0_seq3:153-512(-)
MRRAFASLSNPLGVAARRCRVVADAHVFAACLQLYVSNRGHNSLTHFRVGNDGALDRKGTTPVGGIPRDFTIVDPFVIVGNQDGGKLVVFKMDETTGSLTAVGEPVACSWPATLLAVQP